MSANASHPGPAPAYPEADRGSGTRYWPAADGPVDPADRHTTRGRTAHARHWGRGADYLAPWPTRAWAVAAAAGFVLARTHWDQAFNWPVALTMLAAQCDEATATQALAACGYHVKLAIVMVRKQLSASAAHTLLETANGNVRAALNN